jgi:hypothetical protein
MVRNFSERLPRWPTLLLLVAVIACITVAYDHYYFRVRWPAGIQRETLGSVIAGSDALLSYERQFAFGEGFARWRYRPDTSNETLRRLCNGIEVPRCTFNRSRALSRGVTLTASFHNSVLTVEEWWS